jgi:hypothetical protein
MEDFMRILKWSKMKPLRFKKAPNDARNATATHKNVGGGIGAGSNRRIRRTNS